MAQSSRTGTRNRAPGSLSGRWLAAGIAAWAFNVGMMGLLDAQEMLRTGASAPYHHRITLYGHEGEAISPRDEMAPPYSPKATCGKCHPYASIAHGWHFGGRDAAGSTRTGEPWTFVDPATGTWLPLSDRGGDGVVSFDAFGLSDFEVVLRFGGRLAGGGRLEPGVKAIEDSEESLRWGISGPSEIDCMICHAAGSEHDFAESARQIARQNFKWAATAALGLGVVRGDASKVPDDYDPLAGPNPDDPGAAPPRIEYDLSRFDSNDRVFFDIVRSPGIERCGYCHSVAEVGETAHPGWLDDGDVHTRAGLACSNCHGNGIDHATDRGIADPQDIGLASCEGCHLRGHAASGRFGAPIPEHAGFPPLHFERLACTACHSGALPQESPRPVQTSLAHTLGLPSKHRTDEDRPHVYEPLFEKRQGKVTPMRWYWPAYWSVESDTGRRPLGAKELDELRDALHPRRRSRRSSKALAPLDDAGLTHAFEILSAKFGDSLDYVRDGAHHRLRDGVVVVEPDADAEPIRWPLAHDVRPARRALGAGGCQDCHERGAPFFEAVVSGGGERRMHEYIGFDAGVADRWALAMRWRAFFKWVAAGSCIIVGIVLLRATGRLVAKRVVVGDGGDDAIR